MTIATRPMPRMAQDDSGDDAEPGAQGMPRDDSQDAARNWRRFDFAEDCLVPCTPREKTARG